MRNCASAMEAEAESCLEGVRLVAEWVRQPMVLEADCWHLLQELKSPTSSRAAWSGVIEDILAVCQLLPGWTISRVKRASNGVAHKLGQLAMQQQERVVWRMKAPECVRSLIESERRGGVGDVSNVGQGRASSSTSCNRLNL